MEYEALIVTHLHRIWDESIENGWVSRDEMYDALHAQVSGEMDMSAEDLDEPIARLLGWDIDNITESQYRIWKNIVDKAAQEWISR